MTSYLNLLKINDRSPYDTNFEGDVFVGDDLTVSDDLTVKDLLTVKRIKTEEIETEDKVLINCNTSSTALEVRQLGLGDCLRIEDSTNPDSSSFIVNNIGNVGIGINSPVNKLDVAGAVGCSSLARSNITDGDNYINMTGGSISGIARNQFLRFRTGSSPLSYVGLCLSNYDSMHLRFIPTGGNFALGMSNENNASPTSNSFTENIMTINGTNGNIGFGSTIYQTVPKLTVTNSTGEESLRIQSYGAIPTLSLYRAAGSESSPTSLAVTSNVGRIQFYGRDNSSYQLCASINAIVDNEINTAGDPSDYPTRIGFFTCADGENTLGERLSIKNNGSVCIGQTFTEASAILGLHSTTRGFLPPKLTTVQRNAIVSPVSGLVVYDTTLNNLCTYNGSKWIELVESFSRSFIKLNRTSALTVPGVIAWNTHIKNGSDFNFTNDVSTFSVNTSGYYEIIANFEFLNTVGERLIETLFERITPSQLDISRIFTNCAISDAGDNFISSTLNDIVLLTAGENYRFSFGSQGGSSADLTTNSKVIIKRIT